VIDWARRWTGPAGLARALVWLAAVALGLSLLEDPDLWGHVRFGLDLIDSHRLTLHDHYSYTSDVVWVNHEWLSELVMAPAFRAAGGPGLIVLKTVLVLSMAGLIVFAVSGEARHANRSPEWILACGLTGTVWRLNTLRPQLFSLVLFAAFLVLLTRAGDRWTVRLLALPAVMALWVNVHGAWVMGLIVFSVWSAGELMRPTTKSPSRRLIVISLAVVWFATLLNPYGVGLWEFVIRTVRPSRPDIMEWAPVTGIPIGAALPWLSALAVALVAVVRGYRPSVSVAALLVALGVMSFRVSRLDAFFAVAVAVCVGGPLLARWPAARRLAPKDGPAHFAVTMAALTVIAWPVGQLAVHQRACLPLQAAWLPEPEAVRFLRDSALKGNLLTWFDWGEYAIWHLAPDFRVSLDGRRETVYSEGLFGTQQDLYAGKTSLDVPVVRQADFVWLARDLPGLRRFEANGWVRVFDGPRSIILARPETADVLNEAPRQTHTDEVLTLPRCFPGP
jgi:hypothetical protein